MFYRTSDQKIFRKNQAKSELGKKISCQKQKLIKTRGESSFLEKPGGNVAVVGSELSLISGNYHEQKEPSGVILASAKAKIRHVFCFKNMAAKVTEIGGASPPGIVI